MTSLQMYPSHQCRLQRVEEGSLGVTEDVFETLSVASMLTKNPEYAAHRGLHG